MLLAKFAHDRDSTLARPEAEKRPRIARPSSSALAEAAQSPLQPVFPLTHRYELGQQIGSGGMGVVYKARDRSLNRIVALKFIPQRLRRAERALHAGGQGPGAHRAR